MRTLGYVVVAVVCVAVTFVERSRRAVVPWLAPGFWAGTAAAYAAMAVGRAGELGSLLADVGRRRARDEGWYQSRRELQAGVVIAVAAVWLAGVALAIWRVPERRRRYLPMAVVTFTTLCFGGVRAVSLHQVDTVLYRRWFEGARIGALTEVVLLLLALATVAWCWATPVHRGAVAETDRVASLS